MTMQLESAAKTRSYTGARRDVARMATPGRTAILDVGCASGALAALLGDQHGARTVGIEYDLRTAKVAARTLDRVIVGDLNHWSTVGPALAEEAPFDCILLADVLEHLLDPWSVLDQLLAHLSPGGEVIISLPNVGHHNTLWNVFVRRRFPRRDRGLHDVTHTRWFARRDVEELVSGAGLRIEALKRNYRLVEGPSPRNRLARLFAWPGLRDLMTYQFLVRARR